MNSLIENYINGNLTTAKRQAKRYNHSKLRHAFQEYGYCINGAFAVADYLKGYGSFQAACDAEHASK